MRVEINGLDEVIKSLKGLEETKQQAAALAVNSTARFGFAEASRGIRSDVNLATSYIGTANAGNRLKITKLASAEDTEAKIFAKGRATSLARYSRDATPGKVGVTVNVGKRSGAKKIPKAFAVKLKRGASLSEDQYNVGVALRLKNGEPVRNKSRMKQFGESGKKSTLYLLYAPSVSQVFEEVAVEIEPKVSSFLQREFLRQFERLNRG